MKDISKGQFAAQERDTLQGAFGMTHALRPLALILSGAALLRTHSDPDLWGHVRFGLDLLQSTRLSATDPYSFTQDLPWVNHEWLSELALGSSYALAGSFGLLLLKWLLVGSTLGLLWRHMSDIAPPWRHGLLAFASLGLIPLTSTIRPQLWTVLLVVALWRILGRHDAWRWSAAAVLAVWANVHGGWIVGLGLLAARLTGQVLARSVSLPASAALLGVAAAATLVTPYGVGLWHFIADTVRLGRADITEWQPLWRTGLVPALLWFSATACTAWAWHRVGGQAVAWLPPLLMLAASSMMVNRLVPLYVLVVVLAAASVAPRGGPVRGQRARSLVDAIAVVFALCLIVPPRALTCVPIERTHDLRSPGPTALPALVKAAPSGRMITFFNWGQEALFHLGPKLKVSMDGRRETVYSPRVLSEQYAIFSGHPEGLVALDRLRPEYVWLPLPLSTHTLHWLATHDYRIDIRNEQEFLAVRTDIPRVQSSDSLNGSSCFPEL